MKIKPITPKDIDAVLLCGGEGLRLRPLVSDRPKALAQINHFAFLDYLIRYLAGFGLSRVILCTSYMAEKIEQHYPENKAFGVNILFSREDPPLGTAGAIKNAEALIKSNPFLAVNGDTFLRLDLKNFLDFHLAKKSTFSMALTAPDVNSASGRACVDKSSRVIDFKEKCKKHSVHSFINAGFYLFDKAILSYIPVGKKFSLEEELITRIIKKPCFGFVSRAEFIDIGTPANLRRAAIFFRRLNI